MRSALLVALAVPLTSALAFQVAAPDALTEARTELFAARYAKAAELYSALVAKEPAVPEAYYGLVRALLGARRAAEAYTYGEQALQRAPQTAAAENAAGLALFRKGELAKAETHFRAALKLRANDAAALAGMASIYSVVSKNKTARDLLLKAYALSPDDSALMLAHANSLKGSEHIQALERVLALLDPASEEARNLHAHISVDRATAGRELRRHHALRSHSDQAIPNHGRPDPAERRRLARAIQPAADGESLIGHRRVRHFPCAQGRRKSGLAGSRRRGL